MATAGLKGGTTGTEIQIGGTTYATLRTDGMAIPAAVAAGDAVRLDQIQTLYPTIQKFVAGSGTYTTPANCVVLKIKIVGAGGGGSGSGTTGGGNGGTGGNTTFGTTLLAANGGSGGAYNGSAGAGGTASLGTGPIGLALSGATSAVTAGQYAGTAGVRVNGQPEIASQFASGLGNGGAGAWNNATANVIAGSAGGAGGYVDAIITAPGASYAYAVGAAGTAGSAGTSGLTGYAGGAGYILVEEWYIA